MKQFSIVLNIVLLLGVGYLYYLHFRTKPPVADAGLVVAPKENNVASDKGMEMAYVEMDSIYNNVGFIRQRKKELEDEQKSIASDYERSYHELTAMRDNFIKKGKATDQETAAFQEKLVARQQEIEQTKQVKQQKLGEKGARIMEDLQGKLKRFMTDYNKQKRYTMIFSLGTGLDYLLYKDSALNITSDIVTGLNSKMK